MDQLLREKITEELRTFLNREPLEKEIINAQKDIGIMRKIDEKTNKENFEKLKK